MHWRRAVDELGRVGAKARGTGLETAVPGYGIVLAITGTGCLVALCWAITSRSVAPPPQAPPPPSGLAGFVTRDAQVEKIAGDVARRKVSGRQK